MPVAANSSAIADSQNSAATHNQMSTSVHFRCPPWDCDVTRAVNLARSLCSQGSPRELVPANASAIAVAYRGCLCLFASYICDGKLPLNTGQPLADPGGSRARAMPPQIGCEQNFG